MSYSGYTICMQKWALDKEIKNELGLLLIIISLCNQKGYCFASNEYLSELFQEPEQTISRKLKKLEAKNYLEIVYKKQGYKVVAREIRLTKMLIDDYQKCESPINKNVNRTVNKNVKENNISINNININNIKRESIERESPHPSLNDIELYIKEKQLIVNAKQFYDYFEAGDWKDGKGNIILNWKQKLLTWNKYETKTIASDESQDEVWKRFMERNKDND